MFKEYTVQTTKSSAKLTKSFANIQHSSQNAVSVDISAKEKLFQSVTNLQKRSTISVLNYLIPSCYKMKQVWFGYKHMADQLGFCERTIQRAVHELRDLNIINAQYRLMTSNLYRVNPEIYSLKDRLKHKIPSLWGKFIILSLSLLVGNVLPNGNKNYLSLVSNLTIVREDQYSVSLQGRGKILKNTGRKRMSAQAGKITISPTLKEITQELQLTRHGQCKLLAFDDAVLSLVWNENKSLLKDYNNPISFVIRRCLEQSTIQGLKVDWDIYYLLIKRYDISKQDPLSKTKEPKNSGIIQVDRTDFNKQYQQRIQQIQQESQQRVQEIRKDKPLPEWLQDCTKKFIENHKELHLV
jgi:hypothetical protein